MNLELNGHAVHAQDSLEDAPPDRAFPCLSSSADPDVIRMSARRRIEAFEEKTASIHETGTNPVGGLQLNYDVLPMLIRIGFDTAF
ncbi:MAG: hypothetical protein IPP82_16410 [Xanthomonadales bacterium]|nr:hypothetical protein [Xanthomonadales bacterium]